MEARTLPSRSNSPNAERGVIVTGHGGGVGGQDGAVAWDCKCHCKSILNCGLATHQWFLNPSNQNTLITQKPIVRVGQRVRRPLCWPTVPCTDLGELDLGTQRAVALCPARLYFEDAILVSEKL